MSPPSTTAAQTLGTLREGTVFGAACIAHGLSDFMFSGGVCNHWIIYGEVESHFVQGTLPQNVLPVITSEDVASSLYKVNISDMEPLVKDFASRWNFAIELVHKDVTFCRDLGSGPHAAASVLHQADRLRQEGQWWLCPDQGLGFHILSCTKSKIL